MEFTHINKCTCERSVSHGYITLAWAFETQLLLQRIIIFLTVEVPRWRFQERAWFRWGASWSKAWPWPPKDCRSSDHWPCERRRSASAPGCGRVSVLGGPWFGPAAPETVVASEVITPRQSHWWNSRRLLQQSGFLLLFNAASARDANLRGCGFCFLNSGRSDEPLPDRRCKSPGLFGPKGWRHRAHLRTFRGDLPGRRSRVIHAHRKTELKIFR